MPVKPYERGVAGKKLPGMKLVHHNSKLKPYNMSYKKGRTLIRPWGTINPDGSMQPWRDQSGNFGTSFFVQDMVCMGWGKDMRFTCFLEVEDGDNWPGGSPLQIFLDDMRGHPEYKPILFDRTANTFSALDNPKACGFLKGILIENAGRKYHSNPIWGALLVVPSSARESFDELLNRENSNAEDAGNTDADPHGWAKRYFVGDPIGFQDGKVFEFDKESAFEDTSGGINLDGTGRAQGDGGEIIEKYACRLWPDGSTLPIDPAHQEKVARYDQSFEDALRFMTGEEQINELIIPGFGRSCKEAVLYSFGGKGILPPSFETGRTTVDMGQGATEPSGAQPGTPSTPSMSQQRAAASTPVSDASSLVNLGGSGNDQPADEPPFEPDAQTEESAEPVQEEASAPSTGDEIRARLAAARNK